MSIRSYAPLLATAVLAIAVVALLPAAAMAADPVTIGFVTSVDPAKVPQQKGAFEAATGVQLNWRKFESGADVIAAIASGDVPIGSMGSSPLAAACSRGLPIRAFVIASQLGTSEALVVRKAAGIAGPDQLAGHKIAVPYVSTAHYSLLNALAHWNIAPASVKIVNLRPSEIVAAWRRGDIDGAYVWEPALGRIEPDGNVLATSEQLAQWGAPTFDVWVVRKDFALAHPEFVASFARTVGHAIDSFNANPNTYASNFDNLASISKVTGSSPEVARTMLLGNRYLPLAEQAKVLRQPLAQVLANTANFLKAQGKIDTVLPDYGDCVTAEFVTAGAK